MQQYYVSAVCFRPGVRNASNGPGLPQSRAANLLAVTAAKELLEAALDPGDVRIVCQLPHVPL